MKLPAGADKWGIVILGGVSVFLVSRLVTQFKGTPIGNTQVSAAAPAGRTRAKSGAPRLPNDLAQYDPVVHLDTLEALDARPLPDDDRSPFEYVGEVAPPAPGAPKPVAGAPPVAPKPPPPPPPPPPLPLKAMGYNDLPGGGKQAFVNYQDNMQVVQEGDVVGTRFKILKITPTSLTIEDETNHETHELPFPQ